MQEADFYLPYLLHCLTNLCRMCRMLVMEMTAKSLRKGKMKTQLIFEPNLVFEIRSKFQDCHLRSVRN